MYADTGEEYSQRTPDAVSISALCYVGISAVSKKSGKQDKIRGQVDIGQ